MNCRDVREGLWPPERPRLVGPQVERARAHIRSCRECTRWFAEDRATLDTRHSLQSVRAPLRVQAKVFEALARAREGGTRSRVDAMRAGASRLRKRVAAVGGLLAAGAISALIIGPRLPPDGGARAGVIGEMGSDAAFVEDYLRRAVGEDYLESSDAEEIARFLRRELGLHSNLLSLAGLVPTRVEICLLEGRRGAMVVYRLDGRRVTHYLVPKAAEERPPRIAREHGSLTVVTWSTDALEEALVGEMPSNELLDLARSGITE